MQESIRDRLRARKRRLMRRLDKSNYPEDLEQPMLRARNLQYEVAGRSVGTAYGGIGLIHKLVQEVGLAAEIDRRLVLFKVHLPPSRVGPCAEPGVQRPVRRALPGGPGTATAG